MREVLRQQHDEGTDLGGGQASGPDNINRREYDQLIHSALKEFAETGDVSIISSLDPALQRLAVLKMIDSGQGRSVAQNLDHFQGLNHKEITLKLIEAREKRRNFPCQKFVPFAVIKPNGG